LVERKVGKGTARAASELGAMRSVVIGTKGKRASWAAGYERSVKGKRKAGLTWNLAHESRNCSKGLIIFRIFK
jgi:hypothetical protein